MDSISVCRSRLLGWVLASSLLSACGGSEDGVVGTGFDNPPGDDIRIRGAAEKGPFVKGSEVLVSRLATDGSPSTDTTLSEIQDDLGTFMFAVKQAGPVLIAADGYHFNEITGALSQGRLLLRAVYNANANAEQKAYVNVLTHLAYKRTLVLMSQGVSIDGALKQAELDVLQALSSVLPVTEIIDFTQLSIYDIDTSRATGNGYVLALSATVYQLAMKKEQEQKSSVDAELTALLNALSDDISDDGSIADNTMLTDLTTSTRQLRPDLIRANLEARSVSVGPEKLLIANMDLFIDTDGDGAVNAEDNDDDNDGMLDEEDPSPYVYSEPPTLFEANTYSNLLKDTPLTLTWTVGEAAKQIEVQVAKDKSFANVIFSELAPEFKTTLSLETGVYYVRTRAQNEFGAWGTWSAGDELAVDSFAYMNSPAHFPIPSKLFAEEVMLASDGALVTMGNLGSENPTVFRTGVREDGSGWWGEESNLMGRVESLTELTKGVYAYIVRNDSMSASFSRAQLGVIYDGVEGPIGLSGVDLLEPGLLGGSIGRATLLPAGDGVTIGTTKKWQELTASGETQDFATPFVAKYGGDGKFRWSFDFATTAASGGELTGFWRSADDNYQVAGLLANNNGLFLATLARDGSQILAMSTTDLPSTAVAGGKALPTSDGGYIVLPGVAAGDVYKIDGNGTIQYSRALRTLCDCQLKRVSAFIDGDTLAFGGAASELNGVMIAEDEDRPLLIAKINTGTGELTQRRIYSLDLDWVRAGLGDVNGTYRYSLDSFRLSPDGRILAIGNIRSSAGDHVAPIWIKSDAAGGAPTVLRHGASLF